MTQRFHFISGLPRSGSTLLAALLRQNPRFTAGMTSPVASLCFTVIEGMGPPHQFAAAFDAAKRKSMLQAIFAGYYPPPQPPVVFDTNRVWTGSTALIAELFPDAKIICCVREIGWIIDSLERMVRRNPMQAARIFASNNVRSLPARVEALMNAEIGLIGGAWSNLREAWFTEFADRLLIFSYEGFVADPAGAMSRLYAALGEPAFAHDFANITYDAPDYDVEIGMPGLHAVLPKLEQRVRTPTIPPEVFRKYEANAFWTKTRPGGATIVC